MKTHKPTISYAPTVLELEVMCALPAEKDDAPTAREVAFDLDVSTSEIMQALLVLGHMFGIKADAGDDHLDDRPRAERPGGRVAGGDSEGACERRRTTLGAGRRRWPRDREFAADDHAHWRVGDDRIECARCLILT